MTTLGEAQGGTNTAGTWCPMDNRLLNVCF